VSAGALCVYYTFRNALAIEVSHFFEKQEILENHWATGANREGILVVAYWTACVRCHDVLLVFWLFIFCH
jgi:hypothetical protein